MNKNKISETPLDIAAQRETEKRIKAIRQHLRDFYKLSESSPHQIELLYANCLPEIIENQFEYFNDPRLAKIVVAIIPDELWHKGELQASESDGERLLIKVRQGYIENILEQDRTAWLVHELAHCQVYLDSPDQYADNSVKYEFDNIGSIFPYPNNQVEAKTFSKQFQYLKSVGLSREDIIEMLKKSYTDPNDFIFFDRLLNGVF